MEEIQNQNLSSSSFETTETPTNLDYSVKGESRLITVMYKKIEEMETEIHDLKTKKIIDETQFPLDILEKNNLLPKPKLKLKRGCGYRPLLTSEIEEAKKHSPFAAQQAKWLGVHFLTYKRYCKRYGIWEPKPNSKGKQQPHDPLRGKYPLEKILIGELNSNVMVTDWMVKDKLIRSNTFSARCNICGYDKRRIGDDKICLLVDHKDGDRRNFKLENIQLLCLNCTFECGRGYIRTGKRNFDMDWIQGRDKDEIEDKSRW